jgi:L-threonylcarbamoyladenylate synthase
MFSQNLVGLLKKGKIVVLPTDTLYGIHTPASNKESVEKVYEIRGRAPEKPFIILIGSIEQLKLFNIEVDTEAEKILNKYWPGKVSIILPCPEEKFAYLHRGTKTLAFRLPNKTDLIDLLKQTGPLITTSVNPEGLEPAKTIEECKKYFGEEIDFYVDEGKLDSLPSTLISISGGKITVLRQGEVKIE